MAFTPWMIIIPVRNGEVPSVCFQGYLLKEKFGEVAKDSTQTSVNVPCAGLTRRWPQTRSGRARVNLESVVRRVAVNCIRKVSSQLMGERMLERHARRFRTRGGGSSNYPTRQYG